MKMAYAAFQPRFDAVDFGGNHHVPPIWQKRG
jgi:hypothetical protein